MKLFFSVFLSVLIFSCHNNENEVISSSLSANISQADSLKNALAKFPDSLILLEELLTYYSKSENYDSALKVVNKALMRDSANPFLLDMQSAVMAAKGDTAGAIRSLEKAIYIYPMPVYIISLGALYAQTKNPLALDMADALLTGNKSQAEKEAYFIKGLYYSFNGQKERAIIFFDKSLATDHQFMDAYLEKALALYDLKKYREATEVLTKAVTLQNNFDRGYYYLGRNYEKLNKKEDARQAYEKALLYDPAYEEARIALEKL